MNVTILGNGDVNRLSGTEEQTGLPFVAFSKSEKLKEAVEGKFIGADFNDFPEDTQILQYSTSAVVKSHIELLTGFYDYLHQKEMLNKDIEI
jgi:hypothetical protein